MASLLVFRKWKELGKGVGILLLNDVWHSAVVDFGYVSSRIFCIKFKFSRIKVCVVVGYGPNEGGEKRNRFCYNMDSILDSIGNGYKLCILGDLNSGIGDRTSITGSFGVPEENDNGRSG